MEMIRQDLRQGAFERRDCLIPRLDGANGLWLNQMVSQSTLLIHLVGDEPSAQF